MIVIASSGGRASFPHGWHSTVQRLRLPRRLSESLAENLCDNDAAEIRLANVPAPPISLELKEMGGAVIVPQRSGRGWRSPAAAGRTAGRPIVSYGFVGIAFVSVSRLCPYKGLWVVLKHVVCARHKVTTKTSRSVARSSLDILPVGVHAAEEPEGT